MDKLNLLRRYKHRPRKVTSMVVAELRQAVAAGLTERAAQRQLEQRLKIRLSQPQVHRVMHRLKQEVAEQPALELSPVGADEHEGVAVAVVPESGALKPQEESDQPEQPSVEPAALTLAPGQSIASRYLGLMLFYPALQVVGLLELAARSTNWSA